MAVMQLKYSLDLLLSSYAMDYATHVRS